MRASDLELDDGPALRRRRLLYGTTTLALTAVLGLGVVDGLGWWHAYGVASATVRASGDGYELEVRYGAVSRPALATPFEITVRNPEGFDGPVVLAVAADYLAMWDVNGIVPAPSSEGARGDLVEWEFDPPEGTELAVAYDGRIEPAVQSGRDGTVALVVDGEVVAQVSFRTRVMP